MEPSTPIQSEAIERRIYIVRGRKVMLDADLAELYQVLTKNLNKRSLETLIASRLISCSS